MRHAFDFDPAYRAAAVPFGVTPGTSWVEVADWSLQVRFGWWWRFSTPVSNIASAQEIEDFAFLKTAGPPHLSFSDRGISFTTNGRRALCVRFHDPVPGIDPTGLAARWLRHPGATLSVEDPESLRRDLSDAGAVLASD